jgi:soluble lytic murein transglycosylase
MLLLVMPTAISCKKDVDKQSLSNPAVQESSWSIEVDEPTQQFRGIYKKARSLQKKKDFTGAYDLYNVLDENYGLLHDFVLYQRSEVAKNIPNEASVITDLKELIQKYPDSPLVDLATYSLGQAYIRISDDINARKYFAETIKKYPHSDYAIASEYYLGELNAKTDETKAQAIENFRSYLKEAPDGKFAVNCADGLLKLVDASTLSSTDKQFIGLAYFHGGNYSSAIKYLKPVFNEHTWYALGKSYQLTGNKTEAINIFSKALNSYQGLDPEEIDNAVKATAVMKGSGFDAWNYTQKMYPKYADIALYFKAKKLYHNEALTYYRQVVEKFPDSRYAPESNWAIFWENYNKGNYEEAIKQARFHSKNYPDSKSLSRIVFWAGKAYEKKGDKNTAIAIYEKLIDNVQGDYYSYRAEGRLNELKYGKTDNMWKTEPTGYYYETTWQPPLPVTYKHIANKYSDKAAELIYLDDLESAKYLFKDNMEPLLEGYFHLKDGLISRSIVIIRENQNKHIINPPGNEKSWELLYPLHYSTIIKDNAYKNRLDPLLVQALAREESYFNPQALSSSNAKGLMQLIPSTAQAVANWEKLKSFSQYDLFKPEVNVRLGTRYLKYTHDTFNGNSMLAVASYNGGPGNVNKWIRTIPNADWDQFVENIPLDETRNYVRKVFRSYWAYREIYSGKPVLISKNKTQ